MNQKKYFKLKAEGVQKMIWDLSFKKFKTEEIREEIRAEYDNIKSRLSVLEAQIKSQKETPTMEEGEIKRLDDQKVLMERDRDRFVTQIKGLDVEVNGSKPCEQYHDGVDGITQQLDSLYELKGMVEDYAKKV